MAEKYPNVSSYIYTGNNPINRFDPNGMDWYTDNESQKYQFFEGNGERKGFTHQFSEGYLGFNDDSGLRSYGNADGSTSHYGPIELQAAEVTDKTPGNYNNSPAYKVFGELASGKQNGSDNIYMPMRSDAFSIQMNLNISGMFTEANFSFGVGASLNESGWFLSSSAGTGYSFPGIGLSLQVNFHFATKASENKLANIGGTDLGCLGGLGLFGGYSRTAGYRRNGGFRPTDGYNTFSVGVGLGGGASLGGRTSITTSMYRPFKP